MYSTFLTSVYFAFSVEEISSIIVLPTLYILNPGEFCLYYSLTHGHLHCLKIAPAYRCYVYLLDRKKCRLYSFMAVVHFKFIQISVLKPSVTPALYIFLYRILSLKWLVGNFLGKHYVYEDLLYKYKLVFIVWNSTNASKKWNLPQLFEETSFFLN